MYAISSFSYFLVAFFIHTAAGKPSQNFKIQHKAALVAVRFTNIFTDDIRIRRFNMNYLTCCNSVAYFVT